MSRFSDWYKRWRHGHGFGVHSPFAYRMVREVLRPSHDTGYYAYDDLARARRHHPALISARETELLYRILVDLRPASVGIASDEPTSLIEYIVRLALPHSAITDCCEAEMLICCGKTIPTDVTPKIAYFTDSKNPLIANLWQLSSNCQLYLNPSRALLISNPSIAKQRFDIKF